MTDPQTPNPASRPPSVLFICTGNTARSQMAQVLLEHHAGERFRVQSAGLEPGEINPLTLKVLKERGLPTGHLLAKGVRPLLGEHFTYVVTVCDRAEANCPIFPHTSYRLSWAFDDPAAAQGDEEERLAVFRQVRGEIEDRIQDWLRQQA
ncbi:protein-tyrosine-phosphatase [Deinococcus aetherius]|uniref:Protein-tyrosine-phosphatase n=1 Tax=Deinococcus aetherius TaxID=200252 RepID=A0ABN6RE22_9DEIO|nr:arsenate reductase ArsC [Deinococcus aetherius]BDP41025.1 protein-tyrosine-phosphatase [Deinococcus aetherius]